MKISERGVVYLVWDKTTKTRHIYREFIGNDEVYRKLQGVECSYLPKIELVAEKDGHVAVLEEYIQGDTLAFILKDSPLAAEQARKIAMHLCTALDSLHALGVVHRDIKPENVILRGDEAVLIDFDASRLCKKERNMDTQAMGTAGYAAPEQYGFAQTDARADIYAMGVLLNEMLIKQHPSTKLADGKFLPIISKCIEVNVNRRYNSAKELACSLNQISIPVKKQVHLNVIGILGIVVAACFAIGGVIFMQSHGRAGTEKSNHPNVSADPVQSQPLPTEDVAADSTILQFEDKVWTQNPQGQTNPYGYNTPFEFDLDKDGASESYIFGITFSNEYLYGRILSSERLGMDKQDTIIRDPIPCVWRSNPDGTFEVAEEFIPLLSDAQIDLWRISNSDAPMPTYQPYLETKWPGGIYMTFTYEHLGAWMIEVSAMLGDQKLTAATYSLYVDIEEFQN